MATKRGNSEDMALYVADIVDKKAGFAGVPRFAKPMVEILVAGRRRYAERQVHLMVEALRAVFEENEAYRELFENIVDDEAAEDVLYRWLTSSLDTQSVMAQRSLVRLALHYRAHDKRPDLEFRRLAALLTNCGDAHLSALRDGIRLVLDETHRVSARDTVEFSERSPGRISVRLFRPQLSTASAPTFVDVPDEIDAPLREVLTEAERHAVALVQRSGWANEDITRIANPWVVAFVLGFDSSA